MLGFIVSVDFTVSVSHCKEHKVGVRNWNVCRCILTQVLSRNFLQGPRNTYEKLNHDNRCHDLDLNLVASEHNPEILLLHRGAQYHTRNIALQYFEAIPFISYPIHRSHIPIIPFYINYPAEIHIYIYVCVCVCVRARAGGRE
jgi:hypothetical protein